MPRLVHLAPEKLVRRIERAGLRGSARSVSAEGVVHELGEVVYAMPIVADLAVTYQWLRELRRWRRDRLVAVHFRIPSDEHVFVGRYGAEKESGPARSMIARLLRKPLGGEVIIPRRIPPKEILRIAQVRQDIGWVEDPDTPHRSECVCPVCLPSGMAKLRRRVRGGLRGRSYGCPCSKRR